MLRQRLTCEPREPAISRGVALGCKPLGKLHSSRQDGAVAAERPAGNAPARERNRVGVGFVGWPAAPAASVTPWNRRRAGRESRANPINRFGGKQKPNA
jgi:hypothetical protein